MLDNIESMFTDRKKLLTRLKKKTYPDRIAQFQTDFGHYFREMFEYTNAADDKAQAAGELGRTLVEKVRSAYASPGSGKIRSTDQNDLNLVMIYFVFPSILQTEHPDAVTLADGIFEAWKSGFTKSINKYLDYDTLYNSFKEKTFGIF